MQARSGRWKMLAVLLVCAAPVLASPLLPESAPVQEPATPAPTPAANSIEVDQAEGQDERIAARLSDIFANVPSLSQVEVSVREGVVTLSGTAPDEAAVARAAAGDRSASASATLGARRGDQVRAASAASF